MPATYTWGPEFGAYHRIESQVKLCTWNPSAREAETGQFLELTDQPAQPEQELQALWEIMPSKAWGTGETVPSMRASYHGSAFDQAQTQSVIFQRALDQARIRSVIYKHTSEGRLWNT